MAAPNSEARVKSSVHGSFELTGRELLTSTLGVQTSDASVLNSPPGEVYATRPFVKNSLDVTYELLLTELGTFAWSVPGYWGRSVRLLCPERRTVTR